MHSQRGTVSALTEGDSEQKVRAISRTISALAEGGSKHEEQPIHLHFSEKYILVNIIKYIVFKHPVLELDLELVLSGLLFSMST